MEVNRSFSGHPLDCLTVNSILFYDGKLYSITPLPEHIDAIVEFAFTTIDVFSSDILNTCHTPAKFCIFLLDSTLINLNKTFPEGDSSSKVFVNVFVKVTLSILEIISVT